MCIKGIFITKLSGKFTRASRKSSTRPQFGEVELKVFAIEERTVIMDSKPTLKQINKFSDEYKQRRKLQMLRFFGSTLFTLVTCRLAIKAVQARRYMPNMFQLNHKPPPISYKNEAAQALGLGTGISVGAFAMLTFGTCWIWDVSTFRDFTIRMKQLLGHELVGTETTAPLDSDTAAVVKELESLLHKDSK